MVERGERPWMEGRGLRAALQCWWCSARCGGACVKRQRSATCQLGEIPADPEMTAMEELVVRRWRERSALLRGAVVMRQGQQELCYQKECTDVLQGEGGVNAPAHAPHRALSCQDQDGVICSCKADP